MKREDLYYVIGVVAGFYAYNKLEDKMERDRANKKTPKQYEGRKIKTIPRWRYRYA